VKAAKGCDLIPKVETRNPKPETLNPKPKTCREAWTLLGQENNVSLPRVNGMEVKERV
jgi:hypothetical protein